MRQSDLFPHPEVKAELMVALQAAAEPKRKTWWENYLKGQAQFRGVDMKTTRALAHDWYDRCLSGLDREDRLGLLLGLIRQPHTEDKMAALLILSERLLPQDELDLDVLVRVSLLFDQGHIADWNICDWFCVKLLGPGIERYGRAWADATGGWVQARVIWQRRAAVMAFVNLVDREPVFPNMRGLVLANCSQLVKDPQRFAQTGVGWVLRVLSTVEPEAIDEFLETHLSLFSAEGLRYATEKMSSSQRLFWRNARKALEAKS